MTDPYTVLGLRSDASDQELRAAYRRLVQLHHPDHNGGSEDSARRFAVVRSAYVEALEQRRTAVTKLDPDRDLEERIARLESELAETRRTAPSGRPEVKRPTAEELGYVTTDDSFGKILEDFLDGL